MATAIITNINSVLEQEQFTINAYFVNSSFNSTYYQFDFGSPGDLNIGDKIIVLYSSITIIETTIIDITGIQITVDSMIYGITFPGAFTSDIVLPPDAAVSTVNLDVKVVAAFNPVVIELQRQDFKDNSFQSDFNSGYIAVTCGYIYLGEYFYYPGFVVGAKIQLSYTNYIGEFTIIDITGTQATIDKTWSMFNPFAQVIINFNSRLNFYVELIISQDVVSLVTRTLRFTPNSKGFIRAEISGALRSLINLNYTDPISPGYYRNDDNNLFTPFYFVTRDNWIGSSENAIKYYEDPPCYAIAGAFQIGDPNNGYYNKYFANTEGSIYYPDLMPQWLTQFKNPIYFVGFPFTLSFLGNNYINISYEDYFVRYTITKANGTVQTFDSFYFNFSEFICLSRLDVQLVLDAIIDSNDINETKTIYFRFGRLESGSFLDALAPITFNVKRPIEQSCNTFYVRWLNTLGGWDYWLFEGKIYEGFKVENGNNYESYFDNISDTKDFENVTFKNVSPAVQVGSNTLTKNEAEGL